VLGYQDTFFDEEDGDTGSMKASLLTANRTEIPPWDWLQFDSNNQEFYGVPLKQDIGRKTYQLIVKDREGKRNCDEH
jgi:dystroglycan 1